MSDREKGAPMGDPPGGRLEMMAAAPSSAATGFSTSDGVNRMRNAKQVTKVQSAPQASSGAPSATNYQTGGNAPLYRRVIEKLATNWQPLLGPLTQRKDTTLHKLAAWV